MSILPDFNYRSSMFWIAFGLIALVMLTSCSPSRTIGKMALAQQAAYLDTPSTNGTNLNQLSERVWTFNWHFDRTMIVDTDDGLVIIDSFSDHLTEPLLEALKGVGLDKPVHTLIYTHFHLDHTRGGAVLRPQNVICDFKCEELWDEFPDEDTAGILRPTHTVKGDTKLEIGNVKFELIYLPRSHTDTMYGVLLPEEKSIFLADTVGIRTMSPPGGISVFLPGYMAGLDKVESLEFDTFVPSHFEWGTKDDFVQAAQMQRDSYQWLREAIEHAGGGDGDTPFMKDKERIAMAYDYYYDRMEDKYGDWHGFGTQILPSFLNNFVANYVGG